MLAVKKYNYKDIKLGMKVHFSKKITENDMQNFLKLSGDSNPLHTKDKFAKSKGFTDKVVFGMLTSSYVSQLAGVHMPGQNSLLLSVTINFSNPAYLNDTIDVNGEVVEKLDFCKGIKISFTMTNQNSIKICFGSVLVKVLD